MLTQVTSLEDIYQTSHNFKLPHMQLNSPTPGNKSTPLIYVVRTEEVTITNGSG